MKNPLPLLVFIASLAPLAATAQNNTPPGYTFGNMFPGMFGGNNNNYTVPQGYMNQGQSPFLTMPAPQYPFANPQFPSAPTGQNTPFPANPMAQPTPFWMQTPPGPQPNARYITEIPSTVAPQNTPPGYTVFTPPRFRQVAPPRWAPLPGQAPVGSQMRRPVNNWSLYPDYSGQNLAPAVPATPPKWPTP